MQHLLTITTGIPFSVRTCAARAAFRLTSFVVLMVSIAAATAGNNLLTNSGFEQSSSNPAGWLTRNDSAGKVSLTEQEAHSGRKALSIPPDTAVEQRISDVPAGAYVARCWVKSESAQTITMLLQDPEHPWAAYNCAEVKVPAGQWTQIESFCALDQRGSLALTLGGMSKEFRLYHGTSAELKSPILADDAELVRYEPAQKQTAVWDVEAPSFDWNARDTWQKVETSSPRSFVGIPVIQGRQVVGSLRKKDGGLVIYSVQAGRVEARGAIVPSPGFPGAKCELVQAAGRTGIRVVAATGDREYTAWISNEGLIRIECRHVAEFQLQDCRLRYGLLPSLVGTDVCYDPGQMPAGNRVALPSTQWLVGLVEGNNSLLVAAWDSDSQKVSLGISGQGDQRRIDSLSIGTEPGGFAISFAEHADIWHEEALKEDWLGEYQPISWHPPFHARWMDFFHVTTGQKPSFRDPGIGYAFPLAYAKTRMWGVWFEDWNHYPFFLDGTQTIMHFEKTFVPQGKALIYFLEPAAADLLSPVEVLQKALGVEKAGALLDLEANRLRKLSYSTPDEFVYDRPVCATTTRLSKIKGEEKSTFGVNLATHLYEFIREIRARVDQYSTFFGQLKTFLSAQEKDHPELHEYVAQLQTRIAEAQENSSEIYATPLSAVEQKIDAMKVLLKEGKGDGFNCGDLDVRGTAGSQDDLCRRYNRVVMSLVQTA
ncbi:MAG TPA: hypothetical protein VHI52_17410, partial [Verrucomicrobiae bacterium]|nr:hypothetical protein [Verrucomicrobiae bacterium]